MKRLAFSGSILIALLLFDSCAKNPVTGRNEFMLMSKEQEIAMGQKSDPEIVGFFGLYQDEKLQRFINEKGKEMAAVSHRRDLPFEFKIVDSHVVNAFAVPGGFVYFTRGIMAHFNNEAEFAGVLGHEIGHITARHSAKQYSNAMLGQIGLVAGSIISPEFAQYADVASQGLQLLFLKFGRDAESQSDKLGVEYSTKIGYDAAEMADFFKTLDRLGSKSGGEVPTFLSTHPDPADRESKVAKLAAEWKRKTKATDFEVNRDSYLKMIDGLVYGEDPKQGFVENNVFYHPVLKFQFGIPTSWAVQNTPQQVQMAPSDGKAVMMLTLAEGTSLETAAQATLQKYQLKVLDSKQQRINGLPAIVLIADQQPQQQQQQQQQAQQTIRALMYFIQYGGNIYNLIGISSQTDFNAYQQLFQSTMGTFRELADPSKINKQAERVRVKTVRQDGILSQAFSGLRVEQKRMEELAILNGMTLNDKVERGMLIKVIE
ncbi:MAG: M48 family metalloprotease [Cyclobacteriaceae bacterium]